MRQIIRHLRRLLPFACLFVLPVHAADTMHAPDTMKQRVEGCAECHGAQGQGGANGYYPRIAGKPAQYLYRQLVGFRDGRRQFPPMEWMVRPLDDAYLHEIADYYSKLQPPEHQPQNVPHLSAQALARGRALATEGDASHGIPACSSCHGKALEGVEPGVPALIGLQYDYISAQLGAWRAHTRRSAEPDCMATIAALLSPGDINDVSAWLASRPVPADARPAPAGSVKMPMVCGGKEK